MTVAQAGLRDIGPEKVIGKLSKIDSAKLYEILDSGEPVSTVDQGDFVVHEILQNDGTRVFAIECTANHDRSCLIEF